MFLTRFVVNPARRGSRKLLASPHAMHAAVLAGFPPCGAAGARGASGRVLWRVDNDQGQSPVLYVASPDAPDLTHLVEEAGWPTTATWDTRSYRPLLDRLAPGQGWAFRLTANPVRHVRTEASQAQTKPRGHVTADQQLAWFLARTEALGIEVMSADGKTPSVLVRDRHTRRFGRNGATVTLTMATFDGRLRVTDADLLRAGLVQGVGRAKGYGCGMLTLAPK